MNQVNKLNPTFISFFHGVGGMSIGAKRCGWRSVLATDNWTISQRFHHANFPGEKFLLSDFESLKKDVIMDAVKEEDKLIIENGELDCIVSGSPCQGMSLANIQRSVYDYRNYLMLGQISLALELNPKVMWFEQVPGFLDHSMKPLYSEVMALLSSQPNYTFSLKVLNAIDYKSCQSRDRVTMIMVRKDVGVPSFPSKCKVDLSKQSVGALLKGVSEFRKKPGAAQKNAYQNVAPTLVASNEGMLVYDGTWRLENIIKETI